MPTNFPNELDSLADPSPTSDTYAVSHSAQHANANDAIEALEAKVGVNGSGVTTSLDYLVAQLNAAVSALQSAVTALENAGYLTAADAVTSVASAVGAITLGSGLAMANNVLSCTVSSPVSSVFGRTGTVTAQTGDYTYSQVGADAAGSASTAQTNAEAYASNATNIASGTLAAARLPGGSLVNSLTGDGILFGNSASTGAVTLAFETNWQANTFLAGPSSGVNSTPTKRALVSADLPTATTSAIGGVKAYTAVAHQWINAIGATGAPTSTQPAFADISGTAAVSQGGTGATSTSFTNSELLYYNSTPNAFASASGIYVTGTAGLLQLGAPSTSTGRINLYNSSNSQFLQIAAPVTASPGYTLTLPASAPSSNGLALVCTTGGIASWGGAALEAGSSAITGGGAGGILLDSGGTLQEALQDFIFDSAGTIGVLGSPDTLYIGSSEAGTAGVLALLDVNGPDRVDYLALTVDSGNWYFGGDDQSPGDRTGNIFAATLNGTALALSSQSSGASTHAGTLTNAPAAGNPAFWLPIVINGSTYYVPCWS